MLMKTNLKDLYLEIKKPEELLEFMSKNIRLGFYGSNKQLYDTSDLDSYTLGSEIFWNLSTPSNVLKTGYGNLFDQVELEREWFTKNGYECKTFYIGFMMDKSNSLPEHAYLTYKDGNKWKWFEVCDKINYGIHDFTLLDMLVTFQMKELISNASRFTLVDGEALDALKVFIYNKPKAGINTKEFMSFIKSSHEFPILK